MNAIGVTKKKSKSNRGSSKPESKIGSPLRSLEDDEQPAKLKIQHSDSKKFLIEKKIDDGNHAPFEDTPAKNKSRFKAPSSKKQSSIEKKSSKKEKDSK